MSAGVEFGCRVTFQRGDDVFAFYIPDELLDDVPQKHVGQALAKWAMRVARRLREMETNKIMEGSR